MPRLHSVPVGSKQAPLALRTRRQFNMGICGCVHRVPVNSEPLRVKAVASSFFVDLCDEVGI